MAYHYHSPGITGTSTTAKVFKHSGIRKAKKNETCLNPQTGHVYRCDTAGTLSKAKWKYIRTDVINLPNTSVAQLSTPVRSGNRYTCKWVIPNQFANQKNGRRATSLSVEWFLGIPGKDPKFSKTFDDETTTEKYCQLNNFVSNGKTYNRDSFYPNTSLKLEYLTCKVYGVNAFGAGAPATSTIKFEKPRQPTISNPTINASTGEVSATVTTNAGNDKYERYDTWFKVTVTNTRTGRTWDALNNKTTATSYVLRYDPSDYQQLSYGQYIRVTFEAWARGFAGDSAHVKKTYTVAFPAQTTITNTSAVLSATGKATFQIKTNSSADHPVDQVRLEYLANTQYMRASDIPGDAAWTATDIVDDAQCEALTMPVTQLIPDPGNRSWVRVKSYHGIEAVLFRYSSFVYLKDLETVPPTAVGDVVKVLEYASGDDGKSAVITLGWNANGQDDSTGTELTWSESEDAWRSTDAPTAYTFTWSDGAITHGGVTYQDSATITIKGLKEGVPCFIRARRYLEGNTTTYSSYSDTVTVTPNVAPRDVVLDVPTYVAEGSSIPFAWTYGGGGTQRAWQLLTSSGTVIAQDENAMGSYNLSAERAASLAVNGILSAYVAVATGADFVNSEEKQIRIVEAPSLSLTVPATVTTQASNSFTATSNRECELVAVVSSMGSTGDASIGLRTQPGGETVWSGVLNPSWTASNDVLNATVSLPTGLDLRDKARYTVSCVAVDTLTGLRSQEVSGVFEVAWANRATAPDDYVEITPEITVDDDGKTHYTATITWDIPNTNTGDVVDVYRVTGDGAVLIGSNYAANYSVTDEYAPFGTNLTLYYRVAVRTVDGDTACSDVEYALDGDMMRFDWPEGTLELPYDISLSDGYTKDYTTRKHLDGTTSVYYNEGVTRKGKQSSRLIRLPSQAQIVALRQLARYPGNAFIRLPDGSAYEGCVEVSDISTEGIISTFSLSTTEAATTGAYMLPLPATEGES